MYFSDVGFMAYPSSPITTTRGGKLRFNRVERNDGRGYSVNTGTFTAPAAGMYQFYWSLLFYTRGPINIEFKLNGWRKVRVHRNNEDWSISGSIYLRLKVGDQVYLEAESAGKRINSGRYTNFGGELIRH